MLTGSSHKKGDAIVLEYRSLNLWASVIWVMIMIGFSDVALSRG